MTVHVTLLAGQSNKGAFPLSALPVQMQGTAPYGQTYIWNGDGPYWGVINPGVNTGMPASPLSWGLETSIAYNFAREMAPGDIHLIIVSHKGETGLSAGLGIDWSPASVGEMFDLTTQRINAAKASMALLGIDATPTRVVWTQGETDALAGRSEAQYKTDLASLLGDADAEWTDGIVPWTINGVRSGIGGSGPAIARAQRSECDGETAAYICTHSLPTSDGTHYTPDAILALGAADVSAWLMA